MNRKLYFLTMTPFPYGEASTKRIICLAKAIISKNINCKVIIISRNNYVDNNNHEGIFEGIPYQYLGRSTVKMNGVFSKIQNLYLKFYLFFYSLYKFKKNNIIYGYLGQCSYLKYFLIKIIHLKKAKYIEELSEYPYAPNNLEPNKKNKILNFTFNRLFPNFDGVVAISDNLFKIAIKYVSNRCKVIKIPILVEYEKYNLINHSENVTSPFIFHCGTLTQQKDGILGVLEAYSIFKNKYNLNLKMIIAGDINRSKDKMKILNFINNEKINDYIIFTGFIKYHQICDYLSKSLFVIINKESNQQNLYGFSTKLGEYLAAGKPVIISNVGEAMNWLKDNETALIYQEGNMNELSEKIYYLYQSSSLREKIGNNAKRLCKENFNYLKYGNILEQFIYDI